MIPVPFPPADPVPPRRPTVLLVDDLPTNVGVLLDFLDENGLTVLVADSGAAALSRLDYVVPDLILLDVLMPGMDGFEVCTRLRAGPETREIPVIFMTALSETVDKLRGFAVGAVDYITKPLQPAEVLARIRAHLMIRELQTKLQRQNRALEEEVRLRREAEDQLARLLDRAVLVAAGDGRVRFATVAAETLLRAHFPDAGTSQLPEPVAHWFRRLSSAPLPRSTCLPSEAGGLKVTLLAQNSGGSTSLLRLTGAVPDPASAAKLLAGLGLSPREAEVLYWTAQGKTGAEMAVILEASENTVKRHLQHIFQKLGVENRTAATVCALRVLGLPEPDAP